MNVPPIILGLIGSFVLVQAGLMAADDYWRETLTITFALFPTRFSDGGDFGLGLITLLSHSFLHAGWGHCLINSVWLLAFGTPVARRLGAVRFLCLYVLCVVLAGIGQSWVSGDTMRLVAIIGASGGVSACMGAATRFAFTQRTSMQGSAQSGAGRHIPPLLPLRDIPKHRSVLIFILIWLALNFVFGVLAPLGFSPDGTATSVAWQAHLFGFIGGLVLMSVFDIPRSPSGGPGNAEYGNWKH